MTDHHIRGLLVDEFREVSKRSAALWRQQISNSFSPAQFYILERLNFAGPQKVTDLATALHITSGAITARSDKLIEEGYAIRHRAEDDRRVVYLTITSKGTNKLHAISEQWESVVDRFFIGFTDEQIADQIKLYKKVKENLKMLQEE